MDKQIWAEYLQQAADSKLSAPFPTGILDGPTEVTDAGLNGLQWHHTPAEDKSHPVTISIYQATSKKQAETLYKQKKADKGNWKEWPKDFPNKNEYDNVDHCGIQTGGTPGLAMWIQHEEKASYLVMMRGGTGGTASFEVGMNKGQIYPDPLYMAVTEAANKTDSDTRI